MGSSARCEILAQLCGGQLYLLLEGGLRPERFTWNITEAFVTLTIGMLVGGQGTTPS